MKLSDLTDQELDYIRSSATTNMVSSRDFNATKEILNATQMYLNQNNYKIVAIDSEYIHIKKKDLKEVLKKAVHQVCSGSDHETFLNSLMRLVEAKY